MLRSATSRRRPVLLLLVYGAVLVLVGITASAQAILVSSHFSATALGAIVDSDAATVRKVVGADLRAGDLDPASITPRRVAALEAMLASLTEREALVRAELRAADGTIIAASEPGRHGAAAPADARFDAALQGTAGAEVLDADTAGAAGPLGVGSVLREDLPLMLADGSVPAVLVVWRDAAPIVARLDDVRRDVVLVTVLAAFVAAGLLTLIFRSAQARMARQGAALVEASRTDALTGMLNHGALVEELAARIERARAAGGSVGIALFDLDNFRLLNDTHGHVVGDEVLVAVADTVRAGAPAGSVCGRFGPDEFLVIGEPGRAEDLVPAVEAIRESLAELAAAVPGQDPLPLSVSGAIARYPDDGQSANLLLAALVATLEVASGSGGNQVHVAGGSEPSEASAPSSFDVYQGLVFAIDTKDRYTKRHSEDVARYALFIGRRLGFDDAQLETIRTAGLLHDVGKIGIPDEILRKPSRLTAEEADVVKQHVALGDMIVRDLPGIDDIRRAIRHHHERWDGNGYLDRLARDEIPEIARILSVADTFSAMTTSRPYRKALDIREAIARLGDAAGSQLDERFVRVFLEGLEADAEAPLPGVTQAPLWRPRVRVA